MRFIQTVAILLSLMLTPGLAFAQDVTAPPADAPEKPSDTVSVPPLTPADAAPPEGPAVAPGSQPSAVDEAERSRAKTRRLFGEILGSGAVMALSIGGLRLLGGNDDSQPCTSDLDCEAIGMAALGALSFVTAPIGVYVAGSILSGEGSFFPTFLGSLLMGGGAALLAAGTNPQDDGILFILPAVGTTLGAIIGYELSHASAMRQLEVEPAHGLRVMPALGATRHGGFSGGLVGSF